MAMQKDTFSNKLITWYEANKRKLPWRETKDPYKIWLSEIILQQTRVDQGMPYYHKFVETFPAVEDLANAPQERVLKLWQGLGYYSRARNLHTAAQFITNKLDGVFPNKYKNLLDLKGVGDYTASAVGSICFNLPTAVVDGNVYRVLSRIFGIDTPINSTTGIKEFKALAQQLLFEKDSGTYNQAVMEFGARYCTPANPDCVHCIFKTQCVAFNTREVSKLPVKLKKTKVRKRYFNYLVILDSNSKTQLQQRTEKGIWQQLYEFPLIETTNLVTTTELIAEETFKNLLDSYDLDVPVLFNDIPVIHKLSHQHLVTQFWIVSTNSTLKNGVNISALPDYAVPVLIEKFISKFQPFN